jgi:hypothetical protein
VKAGGKQSLKMEATYSFEKSVDFQRTTWRYIPEDRILQTTALRTANATVKKTAEVHPCLEWDANPRSQCSAMKDILCLRPHDSGKIVG